VGCRPPWSILRPQRVLSGAHGFASGRRSGLGRLTSTPGEPWAPGPFLAGDCPEILNQGILRSPNPVAAGAALGAFVQAVPVLTISQAVARRWKSLRTSNPNRVGLRSPATADPDDAANAASSDGPLPDLPIDTQGRTSVAAYRCAPLGDPDTRWSAVHERR